MMSRARPTILTPQINSYSHIDNDTSCTIKNGGHRNMQLETIRSISNVSKSYSRDEKHYSGKEDKNF